MRWFVLLLLVACLPAAAQTTRSQSSAAGAAGVQSRLQSQGYSGIHDLRRLPDGQWAGKARQNGVEHDVTMAPDGTTRAR
jgi:hypothetical protein